LGKVIYLDTSALFKLYLSEEGSSDVQQLIASQTEPIPIWELLEAELLNTFKLKVFWGDITDVESSGLERQLETHKQQGIYHRTSIDWQYLMNTFIRLSASTAEIGCRAMDIFHVAFALQIGASTFASFDKRQRALAKKEGLKLFPANDPTA
jgi:predicted nucleic acid-binding protein